MSTATGIVSYSGRGLELTERMLREHRDQRLLDEEVRVMSGQLADEKADKFFRAVMRGEVDRSASFEVRLEARDKRAVVEQRDLVVGTTTAGGFTVASDFARRLVESHVNASAIRRAATVFTTETGAALPVPVATGATTATIVAEGGAIPESDPTFAQTPLSSYKYALLLDASNELLADTAVDLGGYIAAEAGRAVGAGAGAHFATGTGTGQPLGAVAASSPYTVSTAPTGNVTAFSRAAILQFYLALAPEYRAEASWIMHPTDFANLVVLEHALGGLTFPSLQNSPPTLFGRPVLVDAFLPTPAASTKSLLFGDLARAYVIREVSTVRFDQAPGMSFSTDVTRFRVLVRTDGRPALGAAAIIGAHSAT
jgi:HK97 family phage major capsid protein